jgi:aryl-alcohol dehydrogenase-like predicted oxidoreductase
MHAQGGLPRNRLGRTALEISLLGFGAEAIGRKGRSFEEASRTLNAVLDLGVTLIDTAAAYGESEAFIGRALHARHKRGEFVLVTKCGWTGDYQPAWSPGEIARTIDTSLARLKVDAIDVLLLHSCDLEMLKRGEAIATMQAARDAGKVRHIGYSGDNQALRFAVESGAFA